MGDDLNSSALSTDDSSEESEFDPNALDSDAFLDAFPDDEDLLEEDPLAMDDEEDAGVFENEDE
jgi:hypothetical protein